MAGMVDAYDKTTGQKIPYKVPKEWFDIPKLSKNLRKTPIQKAREGEKATTATNKKEG